MEIKIELTDMELMKIAEEVMAMAEDPLSPDFLRLHDQYTKGKIEIGLLNKMCPAAVDYATRRKMDDWLRDYGL